MKKVSLALVLLGAIALSPFAARSQDGGKKGAKVASAVATRGNAEGISAAQMKDYLTFIASDELEGRDTGSRGLDIAALFIATHLSRWGLKPAGENGTYFQPVALRRTFIDPTQSQATLGGQSFRYGEDFLAQPLAGTVSAPLVYASHGWVIKAKNINAYDGIDVKDKLVIVLNSLPKGITQRDLTGKPGEDWMNAQMYAQKQGAKGIILVSNFQTMANWAQNRQNAVEKGALAVEGFMTQGGQQMPVIIAAPPLVAALFRGEKSNATTIVERAMAGDPIPSFALDASKQFSFNIAVKSQIAATKNVVAILEGSDPTLKNEYVAVGAHYDHVGVGTPDKTGDAIYNGADDDGSGTVAVMAIAEAFAKGPRPKRSILFVWHAGEERGLWGARYFTEHPTVPISQIITQLNIDMIGRSKKPGDTNPANKDLTNPGEIFVVGSKMMSTELGDISESVNRSYLNLQFIYKFDDPKDPQQFFYRSDHCHYAQKGIPIIFYLDGEHEDYHRPSDSVEKIDFNQMEKVARTIYATAWELGNRAQRPRVDKKLPAELTSN